MSLRFLYLHGFASGPGSSKGLAFESALAGRGASLQRLNLRLPTLQNLSFSAMADFVQKSIGGPEDKAVLIGSSLGGVLAACVAARDPRVAALVLLAPAVRLAGLFRRSIGPAAVMDWETSGWLEIEDHAEKCKTRLTVDFLRELEDLETKGDLWPAVKVPTLIFQGVSDETVPAPLVREWAALQPSARLVLLEDGHDLKASLPAILQDSLRFLSPWL